MTAGSPSAHASGPTGPDGGGRPSPRPAPAFASAEPDLIDHEDRAHQSEAGRDRRPPSVQGAPS